MFYKSFNECIKRWYLFDLELKYEGAVKINFKIFNGNPHFLFDVFIANEIFLKHYNEALFN